MNKVIFIIPYYGKMPEYFTAWLISAKAQKNIDFLLVTDLIKENKNIKSDNIKILPWSFEQLKKHIQSKFNFKIALDKPYKLCDYRVAYGYIFAGNIENYDFWGYCDIDTVFGNLYKFLEKPMNKYDSIGRWGHLSIYRNTPEINQLFTSNSGLFNYQEVFADSRSYCFDETTGIKMMIKKKKIPHYWDFSGMIDMAYCSAVEGAHDFKNYPKQVFFYHKGKLFQCYETSHQIKYRELMYIHFQKKNPIVPSDLGDSFYIFHDKFIPRKGKAMDEQMLQRENLLRMPIIKAIQKNARKIKMLYIYLFKMDKKQRKINLMKRKLSLRE